jgi:hypothetical protein
MTAPSAAVVAERVKTLVDRVEKLEELLAEAYADSDEVLRPRVAQLERQVEELRIGHARYEAARRMNPRQWADAWHLNTSTGKPFDEIIDDLMPFLKGNKC